MMFTGTLAILVAALSTMVSAVIPPGASTPLFYLVATAPDSAGVNFLPIRLRDSSGSWSLASGSGSAAKFYFSGGRLVAGGRGSAVNSGGGSCGRSGQVVTGYTTSKCTNFGLESNSENSQLGAHLGFGGVGGFYTCGRQRDVYYKVNPSDGPSGCSAVSLYTLPVIE